MDNKPYNNDNVEYVEAEPIEPAAPLAPHLHRHSNAPFPNQVYHTKANCIPCCGPVGCLSLVLLATLIFTDWNVRPIMLALSIFILVSFIARMAGKMRN